MISWPSFIIILSLTVINIIIVAIISGNCKSINKMCLYVCVCVRVLVCVCWFAEIFPSSQEIEKKMKSWVGIIRHARRFSKVVWSELNSARHLETLSILLESVERLTRFSLDPPKSCLPFHPGQILVKNQRIKAIRVDQAQVLLQHE